MKRCIKRKTFSSKEKQEIITYYKTKIYTLEELCNFYGCSKAAIYSWLKQDKESDDGSSEKHELEQKLADVMTENRDLKGQLRVLQYALKILATK